MNLALTEVRRAKLRFGLLTAAVALLVFLILGGVLLATTSFKVVYDAREASKTDPLWRDCAEEMITVVPGRALRMRRAARTTAAI